MLSLLVVIGVSFSLFFWDESPKNEEALQGEQNEGDGSRKGASLITSEEVTASLKEQGLDLKGADLPRENVFIRELNGVTPQPYNLEGRALSIYVYPTIEASVKGMKEFGEKTEAAELEPYKMFTNNNLLVFYVDGSEEMNRTLQETINGLDTSQGNQELEADDVTNFVEFKGEVKKVEREGNLQGILVSPHVENETIDYEEAWFFTDNNLSYEPGQVVLVSYDTTQVHTSQFPPHYGAEKISIVKD